MAKTHPDKRPANGNGQAAAGGATDVRKSYWSEADWRRVQSTVDGTDAVASEMEARWGVGRLRLIVDDDLRAKFDIQAKLWNDALWNGERADDAVYHGQAMARAWRALDHAATEAGCRPLEPDIWEVALEDGSVAAITRTNAEAHAVVRQGRAIQVYTLDEIARLLSAFPEISKAKETFSGASVTAARQPLPELPSGGDDLPGIMAS